MPNFLKLVGNSVVGLGFFAVICAADAASAGRDASVGNSGRGRFGMAATAMARMPSMPTLPGGSIGDVSQDLPPSGPSTTPSEPGNGGNPGNGNPPPDDDPPSDNPPTPPAPECPDGGVRNSTYTIENCMNDVQMCVNNTLPGGLASMYNEDIRNSIMNGMGLCRVQVERCVAEVRRDCRNVYLSNADVWIDFNARRVQPEYYNFVLRKTGLTPYQAETVCALLDKNTYGSSFTAVANNGKTTAEYNDRVGAYNHQNGNVLIKKNPQGPIVNHGNPGVDGARGHYARWDASTAECHLRVAAYNKDTHIKNSWLFGVAGNDEPAEVWRVAGDTFTCNKDLFGFSLMNNTKTAAVVGIGGGTLLGAGVGALAGHGKRAFDCNLEKHRKLMLEELQTNGGITKINNYLASELPAGASEITLGQCQDILDLYDRYSQTKQALKECGGLHGISIDIVDVDVEIITHMNATEAEKQAAQQQGQETVVDILENTNADKCGTFPTLNLAMAAGRGVYSCNGPDGICKPASEISAQITVLDGIMTEDVVTLIEKGEKSNMGKSIGIGAAVGAGAGGLATAITAMVEHGNINCRVGDGLAQVGIGKSYSIGSLRDFYVKWNLNLPDTLAPTAQIEDCATWRAACGRYTHDYECTSAMLNYKPTPTSTVTPIRSACTMSGSICIENHPVAKSYGVCE